MFTRMEQPSTRAEFERRLSILRELMISHKIFFPAGTKLSELGLLDVRLLPNGRIDFLSVNESARLMANTASLREFQREDHSADADANETNEESESAALARTLPQKKKQKPKGSRAKGRKAGSKVVPETHPKKKLGPKRKRKVGSTADEENRPKKKPEPRVKRTTEGKAKRKDHKRRREK